MWIPAGRLAFLVEKIPQPDGTLYTAEALGAQLRAAGLSYATTEWAQTALATGADVPDADGQLIAEQFGLEQAGSGYFTDDAAADRTQREIESLVLLRELGFDEVPQMHVNRVGKPCAWLQPGDEEFNTMLRAVAPAIAAHEAAAAAEARTQPTTEPNPEIVAQTPSERRGLTGWLRDLFSR